MNYFSIDNLIIYAFIVISLTVGIITGKGIKDVKEYILANRNFSKWAITFSYVATSIAGAGIVATTAKTLYEWIIVGVVLLLTLTMHIVTSIFLLPRITHFKNCLTLGDVIVALYGEKSNLAGGIIGMLIVFCRSCMDLLTLGIFTNMLLGIEGGWVIVIGGLVLGMYAAYGGIKSIITIDVFQFLIIITALPMMVYIVLNAAGGIKYVFTHMATQGLPAIRKENFYYYLTYFLVWNFFPLGLLNSPYTMQRFLLVKSAKELKEQSLFTAVFALLFKIAVMLIGLAGYIIYPTTPSETLVARLMKEVLPTGPKGLLIMSFMATIMSSMSSCFHAAGFTFIHDIIKPICEKINVQINELKSIRWATILISIIAIGVSLTIHTAYQLCIIPFGLCGPLLMFPVLLGILGLKPDKQAFYYSISATIITFSICKLILPTSQDYYTVLLSIASNGITFFITHLIKNKGFAIINRSAGGEMLWRPRRRSIISTLKQIISTPNRIVQYSQKQSDQCGNPYIPFGIFLTLNYIIPYSLWTNIPSEYQNIMFLLRLVGGTLCGLLILKEKWPKTLVPYLPIFWYFTILFCLPFTNTIMYLLSKGRAEWLLSFMGFTVVIYVLLDWISAPLISILGLILGTIYFKVLAGKIDLSISFIDRYVLIYQMIFFSVVSTIFLYKRQLIFNKIHTQKEYFKYMQQDASSKLVETLKYREELIKELDTHQFAMFDDVTATYIKQAIYRVTDYLRLDVTTIPLDNFLEKIGDIPKLQDSLVYPEIYIQNFTKVKEIQADEHKLYDTLVNSISYIHEHNFNNKPIKIALEDGLIGHTIAHMKNYTKKLEALKITVSTEDILPVKQDIYMIDASKPTSCSHQHEATQSLIENARIIDAHYGYIDVKIPHTHTYVIPVKLRKIRGKVMELLREPAEIHQDELNHPLAIELERKLLNNLKDTQINLNTIHKALNIIKKYHGGVKRKSGEPFFTHPIAVALILLKEIQDQDAIVSALLHDTVEDTSLSLTQIKALFGDTVAFIVSKVTNLEDNFRRISLDDYENLQRLTNYEDERVALVKLSDRLHNMRTIQYHPSLNKQKHIANETLSFFIPMAKQINRIGMAEELEILCIEVLNKEE